MLRKIAFFSFLLLLLASFSLEAREAATSSGIKTIDSAVRTGAGYLTGVLVLTDGANDATIIVYDNTSASGTKLFQGKVAAAANFGGATFEIPIRFSTGCYVDITGTGASYFIYYDF